VRAKQVASILKNLIVWSLLFFIPAKLFAEDIIIGMSAVFTGPSESLGIELYRGSMAYLEHINRGGGVHGRKLMLKVYDDGYNPAPAIQNTITLIEKDQAFVLFGYVGAATVTRILPLLKSYSDASMSLLFPLSGAQPHRQTPYSDQVFNLRASYREETEGLVNHFVSLGRSKIGVFYQADAYGRSGWDGVRRALAKNGNLEITAEATYRRGAGFDKKFHEQVKLLKTANADAVISIGTYAASAAFIRDARETGWQTPIANVSLVASQSLAALLSQNSQSKGKDYTENLVISQVVPSYEDTSLNSVREYRDLMEKYRPTAPSVADKNYRPQRHSFVGFEGFLNAKLLIEILRRMGNKPVRTKLRQTVESIRNFDLGIDAPISFGPDKHQGSQRIYYTTLQGGEIVPLTSWQQWKK
jgi:branched-chain amino acid transport system substrate-binding protein